MFGTYQEAIEILKKVAKDVAGTYLKVSSPRIQGQHQGIMKAIEAIQEAWDNEAAAHAKYNETLPLNSEAPVNEEVKH